MHFWFWLKRNKDPRTNFSRTGRMVEFHKETGITLPKQSLGDGLQKREIDPYTNCLDHCTVVEAIAYNQNTRHQKHRFVSAISSLAHVKLVL